MTENKIATPKSSKSELNRSVFTYSASNSDWDKYYSQNIKHNRIIDPDYEFTRYDASDFELVVSEDLPFRKELLKLFDEVIIEEVKSNIFRYTALHKFGGWYFDADVFLTRSLQNLEHHPALLFHHQDQRIDVRIALKFPKGHPMLFDLIQAIVRNYQEGTHLYDVPWFSGQDLLTAIASHHYDQEITSLAYEDYINFDGGVFATSEHNRQLDWRITQYFGVVKGVNPKFDDMPKRISSTEADIIYTHMKKHGLKKELAQLKAQHPQYFKNHQQLNRLD